MEIGVLPRGHGLFMSVELVPLCVATGTENASPLFHTGDERYAWLNRIQAVSKGTFTSPGTLVNDMYELR